MEQTQNNGYVKSKMEKPPESKCIGSKRKSLIFARKIKNAFYYLLWWLTVTVTFHTIFFPQVYQILGRLSRNGEINILVTINSNHYWFIFLLLSNSHKIMFKSVRIQLAPWIWNENSGHKETVTTGMWELVEIDCKPSTLIIFYLLIIPLAICFTQCFSFLR